jgi:hypothetical protein
MTISNHHWGVSKAQDRVWAQVCGLRPSKAGKRLFLVLQAYIDDSRSVSGTLVLAGYIASAEQWAAFSKDWEELLPYGTLNKHGKYHFKMSEMAMSENRMERVGAFWKVIERHVLMSVSCRTNVNYFPRAMNRFASLGENIDWGYAKNPYLWTFRALLDVFHARREKISQSININEPVDFIFDEQSEKATIISSWDEFLKNRPDDIRALYGATPRFEDDNDFLPLQAADLWAWWVRMWSDKGILQEKLGQQEFASLEIFVTEDDLVDNFRSHLRSSIAPDKSIFDVKSRPV